MCCSGRSRPSVKKGRGGDSHPDPEIRDGSPVSKKNFVWTFRSQFGVKISGGGGGGAQAPPLDPLLAWHDFWALIKFLDLESGRLFEAGHLWNFHHFQQV